MKKHDQIPIVTESKISSILDIISTALKNSPISDQEFKLVLDEIEKYSGLKEILRSQVGDTYASVANDETAKQALLRNAGGNNNSTVRLVEPPPDFFSLSRRRSNTVVVCNMKQVLIPWP